MIPVSKVMVERIRRWAKPEFNPVVLSFPLGLCATCRKDLSTCEALGSVKESVKQKWASFKLQNICIPRGQSASTCSCDICAARRVQANRGAWKPVKISPGGGSQEQEKEEQVKEARPCPRCLQENTGPGIPHSCSQAARKANLAKLTLHFAETSLLSKLRKHI